MNWEPDTRIALIRHPESIKTLADRHGGAGEPLTPQGRSDAITISEFLLQEYEIVSSAARVYASPVVQVKETGEIVAQKTGFPLVIDERLKNIYLGVLDGLSNEEAFIKFPEPAKQLQLWRDNLVDENDVHIPEAETMKDFKHRTRHALDNALEDPCPKWIVVIMTRSVGVSLTNYLLENTELKGQPYTRFLFDPGSITLFEIVQANGAKMIYHNRTDFLGRTVQYADQ